MVCCISKPGFLFNWAIEVEVARNQITLQISIFVVVIPLIRLLSPPQKQPDGQLEPILISLQRTCSVAYNTEVSKEQFQSMIKAGLHNKSSPQKCRSVIQNDCMLLDHFANQIITLGKSLPASSHLHPNSNTKGLDVILS